MATRFVEPSQSLTAGDISRSARRTNPALPVLVKVPGGNAYAVAIADLATIELLQPDGTYVSTACYLLTTIR